MKATTLQRKLDEMSAASAREGKKEEHKSLEKLKMALFAATNCFFNYRKAKKEYSKTVRILAELTPETSPRRFAFLENERDCGLVHIAKFKSGIAPAIKKYHDAIIEYRELAGKLKGEAP